MKRLALLVFAACGGASAASGTIASESTASLSIGGNVAVVSVAEISYVFDADKVAVVRGGVVVARAALPSKTAKWESATVLRGPDGHLWAVAIADGAVWRVTPSGDLEAAGMRLGIHDARALSIDAIGDTWVIGLSDGVAVSHDGLRVKRFAGGEAKRVAAAIERVAIGRKGSVEVYDLANGKSNSYRVDHSAIAFANAASSDSKLIVRAGETLYVEEQGTLKKTSAPDGLRDIAVSGARVWMLTNGGLYAFDASLQKANAKVASKARVYRADHGDVWLANPDRVQRFTTDVTALAKWRTDVAPVFERACSKCHRAGGEAGIDLSTAAAWANHRTVLHDVLTSGAMPPEDHEIVDADRQALLAWLAAKS